MLSESKANALPAGSLLAIRFETSGLKQAGATACYREHLPKALKVLCPAFLQAFVTVFVFPLQRPGPGAAEWAGEDLEAAGQEALRAQIASIYPTWWRG